MNFQNLQRKVTKVKLGYSILTVDPRSRVPIDKKDPWRSFNVKGHEAFLGETKLKAANGIDQGPAAFT